MQTDTTADVRVRALADALDMLTDEDLGALSGWNEDTRAAYRKRRKGPPFVRFGRHYFYPRKTLTKWLESQVREDFGVQAKDVL